MFGRLSNLMRQIILGSIVDAVSAVTTNEVRRQIPWLRHLVLVELYLNSDVTCYVYAFRKKERREEECIFNVICISQDTHPSHTFRGSVVLFICVMDIIM